MVSRRWRNIGFGTNGSSGGNAGLWHKLSSAFVVILGIWMLQGEDNVGKFELALAPCLRCSHMGACSGKSPIGVTGRC